MSEQHFLIISYLEQHMTSGHTHNFTDWIETNLDWCANNTNRLIISHNDISNSNIFIEKKKTWSEISLSFDISMKSIV